LSINQPIYSGGETSALYRKSLAQKEAADAGVHQTLATVSQSVGGAWANLMVAQASINAGSQQVVAAQKAFDGVREEATLGARTTLDVLNAEQELLNARATKLQAEAGRYIGAYQLLSSMGLLTADHLNLGIPSFDPVAYYNAVQNAPATSSQGKALDRILSKIAD
jgi:outer membrane protein